MAAAAILKITKIAKSPQQFYQSLRNLVRWCKMGILTAKNPRWQTPAIMKTVKSPYLQPFTDFDYIWHGDACWSPAPDVKFKFLIFDNLIWQIAGSYRIEKLLIKYIQKREKLE